MRPDRASGLEVVPGALHGLAGPRSRQMVVARVADWFGTREPARGGMGWVSRRMP